VEETETKLITDLIVLHKERDDGNERERIRISQTREARARHSTNNRASLNRAAFSYDVSIDYSNYQCVVIGSMNLGLLTLFHVYAPTIDEVAIVVVGRNLESRDIVLHRRNDQLQRIKETHRSMMQLQYPIIFGRLNQTKLRSEEYSPSRCDYTRWKCTECRSDDYSSSNHRSPRHMHEYAQDAMSPPRFVHHRPRYRNQAGVIPSNTH
ncbi:hypothetical protein EVAR_40030_1, partial [Eumeta japonica]